MRPNRLAISPAMAEELERRRRERHRRRQDTLAVLAESFQIQFINGLPHKVWPDGRTEPVKLKPSATGDGT